MPVTSPVIPFTVTLASALLQVPPVTMLASVTEAPAQTLSKPDIVPASGSALTVTAYVAVALPQLNVAAVYVIVAVPAVMPVTSPVAPFTVTFASALVQVPPVTMLASVTEAPAQTLSKPDIVPASGSALTVTAYVAVALPQLNVAAVYVIVAVPAVMPVTSPVAPFTLTFASALLHVPPLTVLARVTEAPAQTLSRPDIVPASGNALTVTA